MSRRLTAGESNRLERDIPRATTVHLIAGVALLYNMVLTHKITREDLDTFGRDLAAMTSDPDFTFEFLQLIHKHTHS